MEVSINLQTADGKTMEALEAQIQRRCNILNETTEQAMTAMTIQTIKSLRAATPKSKGKIIPLTDTISHPDLGIAIRERHDLVVGFMTRGNGGQRKPCIRIGNVRGAMSSIRPWWKIAKSKVPNGKVFEITLSQGRQETWRKQLSPWYLVAEDLKSAKHWVEFRYNKIVKRYASLYKDGWSRAMQLVSNRQAQFLSQRGKPVIDKNIHVQKTMNADLLGANGEYSITVTDNLKVSGKIIGGDSAVTTAMQKACNATNGYLNNWIRKHDPNEWFNEITDTPFPSELKAS